MAAGGGSPISREIEVYGIPFPAGPMPGMVSNSRSFVAEGVESRDRTPAATDAKPAPGGRRARPVSGG